VRLVRLLLLAVVIQVVCAATGSAASPPGPRLATVQMIATKGSERDENASPPLMALTTFGESGEKRRYLLKELLDDRVKKVVPFPLMGLSGSPSWSANGSTVAFLASKAKMHRGIYLAEADGSHPRLAKGTAKGTDVVFNPVLSPDGRTLAFSRWRFAGKRNYSSTTTWIASLDGGKPRRLTRWRDDLEFIPSSFSPDGSVLALTKDDENLDGPRVVLMRMDGSGSETLIELAEEPVISPDGSRIAFIGYKDQSVFEEDDTHRYSVGELYVANIDGSGVRRLTQNHTVSELAPSWDPSSSRIAYIGLSTATKYFSFFNFMFPEGNSIMEINADGSCPTRILSDPKVANYGVAWQPGPGREAGPIEC